MSNELERIAEIAEKASPRIPINRDVRWQFPRYTDAKCAVEGCTKRMTDFDVTYCADHELFRVRPKSK